MPGACAYSFPDIWVLTGRPLTCVPKCACAGYDERLNKDKKTSLQETPVGLCASCGFMRRIISDRGSAFYLCERSASDPVYPKYPRLPVKACPGYADVTLSKLPTR